MTTKKGMSLKVQLYLLIAVLSVFTFGASLYNNISHMRGYLSEQLATHAEGAAHSLGLSISPYMDEEGLVIAKTMTNAVFDSGYYKTIQFFDIDNKLVFQRTNPDGLLAIPQWFITLFPLTPPKMTSEISDGWRIAGQLVVQSHAGTSYQTLYEHSLSTLKSTLLQLLFALVCAYFILKSVLTPLKSIEQQAADVIQKKFTLNNITPFTTELRTVVNAINNMVSNIQRAFNEQTQTAEKLSKEVYLDPLTELPNRRALLQKFDSLKAEFDVNINPIYLGLISMTSLQEINDNEGYTSGDEYILEGAHLINKILAPYSGVELYRISGSEFAILSSSTDESIKTISEHISESFIQAKTNRFPSGFAQHSIAKVKPTDGFGEVAKRLDTQLTLNNFNASPKHGIINTSDTQKRSREEWMGILRQFTEYFRNEVLKTDVNDFQIKCIPLDKAFDLMLQPIVNEQNEILYVESFVRFKYEDEVLPTVEVFAMAERLGVLVELEQAVVCFIFYKLQHVANTRVAINISDKVLHNTDFTEWLFKLYQQQEKTLPPILFEFNENAAISSLESTQAFIATAKANNINVAIERFGSSLSSFCYIRNFDIDFIKIDGSYIRDLAQADTQFFVQTVTQICHGIGIKLIAPQIETSQIAQKCALMNIDGMQGNGLYNVRNFNTIISSTAKVASQLELTYFNLPKEIGENDA
ncbi:EAL domain-containing protein [Shewanella gaetbuli]